MKDFFVVNKHTGHLLGMVRAASVEAARVLARTLLGFYASVD